MRILVTEPGSAPRLEDIAQSEFLDYCHKAIGNDLDANTILPAGPGRKPGVQMWIDDFGLYKELPPNEVATKIYWDARGRTPYPIVGMAVFMGFDFRGDSVDVSEDWLSMVMK